MKYVLLIVGLALLVKGADVFVTGASSIATRLRIPPLIVGLTVVAFGTSAPEAAVSVTAALGGQNDLTMGNIVGSNMFNLLVVVGVAACILPFKVKTTILAKEFPLVILSSVVLLVLSADVWLNSAGENVVTRGDGIILLAFFAIFLYYLLEVALKASREGGDEAVFVALTLPKSLLMTVGGLLAVVIGGQITVDCATAIALVWGMSEAMVGLTIVAVGTSLPELVTSMVAAVKGESDIALGNVIGSNIFNVFFVLGISSILAPVTTSPVVVFDSVLLLLASLAAYAFAISRHKVVKIEGLALVALYVVYLAFVIIRN